MKMIEETFKACIEKLTLGLRCCVESYARCKECPYYDDDYRHRCEKKLQNDALRFLNFLETGVTTFEFRIICADEQRSDNENG